MKMYNLEQIIFQKGKINPLFLTSLQLISVTYTDPQVLPLRKIFPKENPIKTEQPQLSKRGTAKHMFNSACMKIFTQRPGHTSLLQVHAIDLPAQHPSGDEVGGRAVAD